MEVDLSLLSSAPKASGNDIYSSVILIDPSDETVREVCRLVEIETRTLPSGKNAEIFIISQNDQELVAKVITEGRFSNYYAQQIFDNRDLIRSIIQNPEVAKCLSPQVNDYQYIGLDSFANELIVSVVANSILSRKNIPSTVNTFSQFTICSQYSALISPLADLGNMYSLALREDNATRDYFIYYEGQYLPAKSKSIRILRPDLVLELIKQIVVTLEILSEEVEFVSGDLKLENILVTTQNTSFSHKGVQVDSPLRVKITDLAGGSVTIGSSNRLDSRNIRLFNQIRITRFFSGGVTKFKSDVSRSTVCYQGPNIADENLSKIEAGNFESFCDDATWWRLPDKFSSSISFITMHSGLPFYRSYDLYIFMVSLMMVPQYYYAVASSAPLRSIWRSLWLAQDLPRVRDKIRDNFGSRPSLAASIDILRGFRMRCDAVEHTRELLASIETGTTGVSYDGF